MISESQTGRPGMASGWVIGQRVGLTERDEQQSRQKRRRQTNTDKYNHRSLSISPAQPRKRGQVTMSQPEHTHAQRERGNQELMDFLTTVYNNCLQTLTTTVLFRQ